MNENDLLDNVVELAYYRRWLVAHQRPARTNQGWRTAIQGHPGFPDLILSRSGVTIAAELKSERGIIGQSQIRWLNALGETPGLNVYLWRPAHWMNGTIDRILDGRDPAAEYDSGAWHYHDPATA